MEEKQMKRILAMFLAMLMLFSTPLETLASQGTDLNVVTEILTDTESESEYVTEAESESELKTETEIVEDTEEELSTEVETEIVEDAEIIEVIVEVENLLENEEGDPSITRIEWLQTLTSAYEMSVEQNNYPDNYFSDIDATYVHYYDVMLATEFGLVDVEAGDALRPDDVATREFVARSLNACMGYVLEDKTYTFSESGDVIYADDIQVAINNGWFELSENGEFLPEQQVTVAEKDVLAAAAEADALERVIDVNHENSYTLKEDVIVIPANVIVALVDEETYELSEIVNTFAVGDKIALLSGTFPVVKKVVEITTIDGTMTIRTENVEAEEAFENIDYEGVMDGVLSGVQAYGDNIELTYIVGGTEELNYEDGIEYQSAEGLREEDISAVRVEKNYAVSSEVGAEFELDEGASITLSYTISDVTADYRINTIAPYISFNFETSFSCNVEMNVLEAMGIETSIDLVKVPVGLVGYASLSLECDLGGEITYNSEQVANIGIRWTEYSGFQLTKSFTKKSFTLQAKVKAALGVKVAVGFDVVILNGELYVETGAESYAESTLHSDGKEPYNCVHVTAHWYLKAGAKVTLDLFVAEVYAKLEKEFFNESNSPIKLAFHFEDGKAVSVCSRDAGNVTYKYYTPADTRYGYNGSSSGVGSNGETYSIFSYEIISSKKIRITSYNGNHSVLNIPSTLDGYEVAEIGNKAFYNNDNLQMVVIPDTVTAIYSYAFSNCDNLVTVSLPEELEAISSYTFYGCTKLESIKLGKNVTTISDNAFNGCTRLSNVKLGRVQTLGDAVFGNCTSLEEIVIPKTLKSVSWPLTSDAPFVGCTELGTVVFEEGITSIPANLLCGNSCITSVKLPESVETIGDQAFYGCTKLESIEFGENVTTIGDNAFNGCTRLSNVKLGRVQTLGDAVFGNCTSLEEIVIPKTLKSVSGRSSSEVPFAGCTELGAVLFEEGITSIPAYLLMGNKRITSVELPESVETINAYAFADCTELKSIELGEKVTQIGQYAFGGCTSLSSVKLTKVQSLGYGVFSGCTELEEIVIPKTLKTVDGYNSTNVPFSGCTELGTVVFEEGITSIPSYLFMGNKCITGVELPESVETIGGYAFNGCTELKSIELGEKVTQIGQYAFGGCTSLSSVKLTKVQSLGYGVFSGCTELEEIVIPKTLKTVDGYNSTNVPFSGCTELGTVVFEEGITSIPSYLFMGNKCITGVELPESVETIGGYAFNGCTELKSIELGEKVTGVGDHAFSGCTSLSSVKLAKVQTLGRSAFENCTSLKEIVIPKTLKAVNVAYPAFTGCTEIQKVYFENGTVTILGYLLSNCKGLEKVYVPDTVTSVGNYAFSGCSNFTICTFKDAWIISWAETNGIPYEIVEIPIEAIALDVTEAELKMSETLQLNTVVKPGLYSDKLTWSTSDKAIATVSKDGLVTAGSKAGAVTITVTAESGASASCTINVVIPFCNITYHLDGGINSEENLDIFYITDATFALKNASKEGYTFAGWYSDETLKKKVTQIKAGTKDDTELYAKWTPNSYTVKFNSNGGTGSTKNLALKYDVEGVLTNNNFKRKGYTFIGWNTEKDGSGNAYVNMEDVMNLTSVNKATVTMYAQWQIEEYTISYEANGGTLAEGSQEKYDATTETFVLGEPVRENYTFAGWYSDANLKKKVTQIKKGSVGDVTFYAKWTPNKYSVQFDKNDAKATGKTNTMKNLAFDAEYTLTKVGFKKTGCSFVEWNTKADGSGVAYGNTAIIEGLSTRDGDTVTLYAQWEEAEYTIFCDLTGGSGSVNPITYKISDVDITLQTPVREGYDFANWCSDAKLKKKVSNIIKSGSTGDKTFYAKWTPHKYAIIFDANTTDSVSGSMKKLNATYDKEVTLTNAAFKRAGYEVAGWTTVEGGTVVEFSNKEKVKNLTSEKGATVTLYAVWKPADCEIIYKNGGDINPNQTVFEVGSTDVITLQNSERIGYDFVGWYSDSKFKKPISSIDLTGKTKDITVYAKWTAHKYTIEFDGNGAESGTMKDLTARVYDKKYALTGNAFKRTGYNFVGWTLDEDGNGDVYKNKAKVKNLTAGEGDIVTLYAKWERIEYKITYKNGDETNPNPASYNVDDETIVLADMTREGYTFGGWYSDSKFKKTVTAIETGSTGNRTLYAKWTAHKYTIKFDKNLGDGTVEVTGTMKDLTSRVFGKTYTLGKNTFKRTGYTFAGWNTAADGTGDFIKDKAKVSNLTTVDNGVVILYAQWEAIPYVITYHLNGGINSAENSETYTVENSISLKDATMEGYEFKGWYSDVLGLKKVTEIEVGKIGNITLYARWKKIK